MQSDAFEAADVRLLGEIGYAAVGHGMHHGAERIFSALQALRPGSAAAGIGRALMALSRGRHEEAVRLVEREALAVEPSSIEAHEVLALALELAGRASERQRVLEAIAGLRRAQGETAPDET